MLYLIRHGECVGNVFHTIVGQSDSPLTSRGVAQATALAASFKDKELTQVWTSDLTRAIDTGRIISNACGASFNQDRRLSEIDTGALTGRASSSVPGDVFDAPGVEALKSVQARALSVLSDASKAQGSLALVTHSGWLRTAMAFYKPCHPLEIAAPSNGAVFTFSNGIFEEITQKLGTLL